MTEFILFFNVKSYKVKEIKGIHTLVFSYSCFTASLESRSEISATLILQRVK